MKVEDLVKQAQAYLDGENGDGSSSGKKELGMDNTPNVFGMASVDELEYSVGRLDILMAAMWTIMKEKGATDDELMTAISSIIEDRKGVVYQKNVLKCARCGNNIQEVKKTPLTGRCYYCGTMYLLYPYNDGDVKDPIVSGTVSEQEAPVPAEEAPAEAENVEELPMTFEPYDVTKDLGFDEDE
ncbi:hypothetical protein SAMN02910456_00085 [Ruminococcaceae bacterium YRB3002]|nr:hypothetical protein SAMN02910456_00085 [Ruminococcaceae bacterium YRB3002]